MRALLAPLSRWLDRRIDAQIAVVREQRARDMISREVALNSEAERRREEIATAETMTRRLRSASRDLTSRMEA